MWLGDCEVDHRLNLDLTAYNSKYVIHFHLTSTKTKNLRIYLTTRRY